MRKKLIELSKAKGFYAVLLLCFVAIALMAGVYVMSTTDKTNNLVDLNEPTEELAIKDDNTGLEVNNEGLDTANMNNAEDNSPLEIPDDYAGNQSEIYNRYDEYVEIFEEDTTVVKEETNETTEPIITSDSVKDEQTENEIAKEVSGTSVQNNLGFNEDEGLAWPIKGNVILNYNMDSTVYFQTLDQYKCNPAIIIEAKVGDEVKSSAKGIVDSVENSSETGLTITVSLGDNYKLVYGQLSDVQLKAGDLIEAGVTLGRIAEPTGYYELEGSNLYFKVLKKGQTINPMTLLQ